MSRLHLPQISPIDFLSASGATIRVRVSQLRLVGHVRCTRTAAPIQKAWSSEKLSTASIILADIIFGRCSFREIPRYGLRETELEDASLFLVDHPKPMFLQSPR